MYIIHTMPCNSYITHIIPDIWRGDTPKKSLGVPFTKRDDPPSR